MEADEHKQAAQRAADTEDTTATGGASGSSQSTNTDIWTICMQYLRHPITGDRVLWIIVAVLAIISVLVVYSSTAKMAYDAHTARTTAHFLRQQLMILICSLAAFAIVQRINCRYYGRWALPIYLLSVIFTIAVYFVSNPTNGAARWIQIGPFQFQPSEALKVATVMFLAQLLASRQSKIDQIRIVPSWRFWTWRSSPKQRRIWREGTWPILMPVIISCVVIFPAHTSSAVLVFATSWVMMLIGRVRFGELMKLVGWAVAAVLLITTLNLGRSQTAEGRVGTWIHLWTQPQTEKPVEMLTDTERSMIAIHNGGILGKGAGQSTMRVEMIHPESDYAYAFFVEEYGILFAVGLLMLYLWIFFRTIEIFRRCGTAFPGLLVLGAGLLITCQALLHIMVTVNLIPETGQTLPLISRGGSSVLFTAIALGMILSVSRQNEEQSHDTPKAETIYEK
ncbi:MAG: FtsW/RodA/SpoVE family cell cycle protein [Alistipes sp.]